MLPVDADPLARRHWTVDDLDDLPDDGLRYECLDGQLVVVTPPQTLHQVVAMRLLRQLDPQIPPGWQLLYDQRVRLGTDWRIPDFVVLPSDAPLDGRVHDPETVGLAVEIVSPTSRRTDRIVKPAEYADAGVPFYWRVETEPRVLVAAHSLDVAGTASRSCSTPDPAGSRPPSRSASTSTRSIRVSSRPAGVRRCVGTPGPRPALRALTPPCLRT